MLWCRSCLISHDSSVTSGLARGFSGHVAYGLGGRYTLTTGTYRTIVAAARWRARCRLLMSLWQPRFRSVTAGVRRLGLAAIQALLVLVLAGGAAALVLVGLGQVPDEPACRWAWHMRWVYHAPAVLPAAFCGITRGFYTMLGGLCGVGAYITAKRLVMQTRD